MGNNLSEKVGFVLVIIIASFMILPAAVLPQQDIEPAIEIEEKHSVINLLEQGITFNTSQGYDISPEWLKPESDTYMVQFTDVARESWDSGIEEIAGPVLRSIGDDIIVLRMNQEQKAEIHKLDYVQWIGTYEPAFKVQKQLIELSGSVQIEAYAFPDSDITILEQELKSIGAWETVNSGYNSIVCWIDSDNLASAAKMESISLISHVPEMEPWLNVGGRIVESWDLWDSDISNLPLDLKGEGQLIHLQDTGVDATHMDLTMGPLGNRIFYAESSTDTYGHGTSMAGAILGNGYCSEQYLGLSTSDRIYNELATSNPSDWQDRAAFAGRAPEAQLISYSGFTSTEWDNGYAMGARIFSNSWGPVITTSGYSSTADTFMDNYPGALLFFGTGSNGPRESTVSGNGNGKLVMCVGTSENMRPALGFDDNSNDPNQIYSWSGRGPVSSTDLRVKPDIVEVGAMVITPKSDDYDDFTYVYNSLDIIDEDGDGLNDYRSITGTSVAVASAAGDAALIRQYLTDVNGYIDPHANIIKTLLIHGAEDIGYGYPSYDQGWGRVNVRRSISPPAPEVIQWEHVDAGTTGTWDASVNGGMNLLVTNNKVPLKITMAHWDSVGSGTLTTDYDLVVTSPSGTRYEGNGFVEGWSTPISTPADWTTCSFPSWMGGQAYDWDNSGDGGDDINNVEVARFQNPEFGIWTIEVISKSAGGEAFTLAVTGGMEPQYDMDNDNYRVGLDMGKKRVIPERDDFGDTVYQGQPGGTVPIDFWIHNGGKLSDNYTISATLPAGFTINYDLVNPVFVDSGQSVHDFANISVDGSVAVGTHTIRLQALSNDDGTVPISQAEISFQIDIMDTILSDRIFVAGEKTHEDNPTPIAWTDGINDYIGLAYRENRLFGDVVMFKLSSDGGETWGTPYQVSEASCRPRWMDIDRDPVSGRIMIAYSATNPDGYNDNNQDTRMNQVRIAYADFPYTSWTEVLAFDLGEGPGSNNYYYRAINIVYCQAVNEWHLIIEAFEYSSTDMGSASLINIMCLDKFSTDGGVSWSTLIRIDSGIAGRYYFFPHAYCDYLGNIVVWYYERDSGDPVQDRDAVFQYYDGAWTLPVVCWDSPDNLMMPQGVAAPQGINGNRNFAMYLKGPHTEADRNFYLMYTDDEGISFDTNLSAGYGPLANVVASDHSYATRFCADMSYTTDGTIWSTFLRHVKYDPFGQQNIITSYGDFLPFEHTDYITQDSYHKNKVRVAELEGYNYIFYDTHTSENGVDIVMVKKNNTNPLSSPEMTIEKTAPAFASPGEIITYTLSFDNIGSGIAANVVVTDLYPAGVTFVGAMPLPDNLGAGNNSWSLGFVLPGESVVISIMVEVDNDASGTLTNWASLDYEDLGGVPYPTIWASADTLIAGPSMVIEKVGPVSANTGETITYQINYVNLGGGMATNVVIEDAFPPELTFVDSSPAGIDMGTHIIWFIGDVPGGTGGTIFVNFTVMASSPSMIENSAWLNYTDMSGTPYPTEMDNAFTMLTSPFMNITKDGPATAFNGDFISYWINYTNTGDDWAYNVVITETYPAGVTFISAIPAPDIGNNVWNIGMVAPGSSGSIQIIVQINPSVVGIITNYVTLDYENSAAIAQPTEYASADTMIAFQLQLNQGWNLFSLPLIPPDSSLDGILGDALTGGTDQGQSDKVFKWDPVESEWLVAYLYEDGIPANTGWLFVTDTFTMEPDFAYWVWIRDDLNHSAVTINMFGAIPGERNVNMSVGWNLVGYTSVNTVTLQNGEIDSSGLYSSGFTGGLAQAESDRIYAWDGIGWQVQYIWENGTSPLDGTWVGTTFDLAPGQGYWIEIREAHTEFIWNYG